MDNAPITRFVGMDLHKHVTMVAAEDAQQQLMLKPTRPHPPGRPRRRFISAPHDAVVALRLHRAASRPRGLASEAEILTRFPEPTIQV